MSSDWQEVVNSVPKQSKCPRCGVPNKCAMENGKSASACWCMGMPKVEAISGDSCLCRSCLTKAISPCIKKCKLNKETQRCNSCKRTLNEIKLWSSFTLEQKLDIINRNSENS